MAYTMLGMYTCEKISETQFKVIFNIPDNCFKTIDFAAGKYTISVKLNPGQTTPSTTFVQQNEIVNIVSNGVYVKFEQYESATVVIKKPIVQIDQ